MHLAIRAKLMRRRRRRGTVVSLLFATGHVIDGEDIWSMLVDLTCGQFGFVIRALLCYYVTKHLELRVRSTIGAVAKALSYIKGL